MVWVFVFVFSVVVVVLGFGFFLEYGFICLFLVTCEGLQVLSKQLENISVLQITMRKLYGKGEVVWVVDRTL